MEPRYQGSGLAIVFVPGSLALMDVPARIEVEKGAVVTLTWEDGSVTRLKAELLRGACQCATCREPSGEAATAEVLDGPEPVTITNAALVGAYAVNFSFAPDDHHTGIFPFERLRSLGAEEAVG